ncbi:ribosome small subunit-dependent GTPase A [Mycoplasmopsis ciconiae]|uniref:Small ribosomal subunit biogenesis GTPase RsgA n=1 Tax=Mycoplasmopsis ciconiae TaxID=561067 RepID=A0ABU7ML07_9BACT|nr:ribosome small subunit-dependent GTPase A [Mycoplasmopsis ciconiae]
MQQGKIYSIISGVYHVKVEDKILKVHGSGKLRFLNLTPLVGDYVSIQNDQISDIFERKNSFIRPKVANVDQVIVVMSLKEPEFQPFLMDKYLSIIEYKNIKPVIFLTKSDLCDDFYWYDQYKKIGYEVYLIDNKNQNYLEHLKHIFKDKTNVFLGQSGVGKTTTINYLSNNSYQTQAISKALNRGKHTTRVLRIIEFNEGELIDTPGFSSLNLDLSALELAQSYDIFKKYYPLCKYRSCFHISELTKDCAVKLALEKGEIPNWRYTNYLKLNSETTKRF